jgi:hypothetical protein
MTSTRSSIVGDGAFHCVVETRACSSQCMEHVPFLLGAVGAYCGVNSKEELQEELRRLQRVPLADAERGDIISCQACNGSLGENTLHVHTLVSCGNVVACLSGSHV